MSLSFCLTICLYVPPPTSLNIISCKYENRQRLQFTIEFAEQDEKKQCTILARLCRHCQGKAKHIRIRAQAILFCSSDRFSFDLLTLKVISESRVTWTTSALILVLLGVSALDLGPMYATDRQKTDSRQTASSLYRLLCLLGARHN